MFTGIVQAIGSLHSLAKAAPSTLVVDAVFPSEVHLGDSVAVNGACLTVVAMDGNQFEFNISEETLRLSIFADLTAKSPLNLELAMTLADRLGGHLVSGHLDGMARVKSVQKKSGSTTFGFITTERGWQKFMIHKGSIAINGVSLTISGLSGLEFKVDVIPHTLTSTNLQYLKIGDRVNVELDLLGKYLYNFSLKKE